MSANKGFTLEVVTPVGSKFEGQVQSVTLPGALGEMGVLAKHAPLVSLLRPGRMRIKSTDSLRCFSIGEGFVQVYNDRVICMVDFAEESEVGKREEHHG